MQRALRRCSSSLSRSSVPRSFYYRCPRSLLSSSNVPSLRTLSCTNPVPSLRHFQTSTRWAQDDASVVHDDAQPSENNDEPATTFEQLKERKLIHPLLLRSLTNDMGLHTMTDIQTLTVHKGLQGKDIVAQAKTGTGKTLAFLIPIFERILNQEPHLKENRRQRRAGVGDTRAIILSPTRELAEQISVEAKKLAKYTGIIVQTAVGGTGKRFMLQLMHAQGCHVLVATPGRLNDILADPNTGVTTQKVSGFVLDEADRLLDEGFWPQVEEIKRSLPDPADLDRQSLMFSATIPRQVVGIVEDTLKPGFEFIKTVDDDEVPTHQRVQQSLVRAEGLENMLPALYELISRETMDRQDGAKPFKAIVYFNTTAETDYANAAFYHLRRKDSNLPTVIQIHARLTQQGRTSAAMAFKRASSAILLSSDVTARGMDFPDVTHVIQMGLPRDSDTYVHRLGRTARAGKEGEGWLFISPMEERDVKRRLRGIPIKPDSSLRAAEVDMREEADVPESVAQILTSVTNALQNVDRISKANYFRSMLGAFNWVQNKQDLVDALGNLSRYSWGMAQTPPVSRVLARKLGFDRTDGLNISDEPSFEGGRRDSGYGRVRPSGFGERRGGFGDRRSSFGSSRGSSFGDRQSSFGSSGGSSYGSRDGFRDRESSRPRNSWQGGGRTASRDRPRY